MVRYMKLEGNSCVEWKELEGREYKQIDNLLSLFGRWDFETGFVCVTVLAVLELVL